MKVEYPPTAIFILIDTVLERVDYARTLSSEAGVKRELLDLYDEVEQRIVDLKSIIIKNGFTTEYTNFLAQALNNFTSGFSRAYVNYANRKPIVLQEEEKPIFKNQQERDEREIKNALSAFISISNFFINLSFLTKDLVIVGANGSGKSSLASHLREHIRGLGIVISAQKALQLHPVDKLMSAVSVNEELKKIQLTLKERSIDFASAQSEFTILIQALLVDQNQYANEYKQETQSRLLSGISPELPRATKLEQLLQLWNSVFSHLTLSLEDGLNLIATNASNRIFVGEMSDGEKAALFYIAHVILCPSKGFVIVDEPEMYLHPTVCKRLWDKLEQERSDCIFIYLTHNLDFAVSRMDAKKIWIRKFTFPAQFEFDAISPNEIPEPLLLELLGTRQRILFCEGKQGGLDEVVYSMLFPQYAIKPVGGCSNVINFTRAFNNLPNTMAKAVGIIDSDFHAQERLSLLSQNAIFNLQLPEIENVLFDELVLLRTCEKLKKSERILKIKNGILKQLRSERKLQVARFVSAKVDNYFKEHNVTKGNDMESLVDNLDEFTKQINVKLWAEEQDRKLLSVIEQENYGEVIRVFNFKGLESIANAHLKIPNYNQQAIFMIRQDDEIKKHLLKYLPGFSYEPPIN